MENGRLNVDVEGMPVQLAVINGREGLRNDDREYYAWNADGMPFGVSSPTEDSQEAIVDEEDEMEEGRTEAATRLGNMTAKITVYDGNGNLVEVRIIRRQEEILRLLDRDISPVFT